MTWKGFGSNQSWSRQDTTVEFGRRDWNTHYSPYHDMRCPSKVQTEGLWRFSATLTCSVCDRCLGLNETVDIMFSGLYSET
jgi:hypothetical protein